jgi:hypothetical protein
MNKSVKKLKTAQINDVTNDQSSLKLEFIRRIASAKNLDEETRFNLLTNLEGTYLEGRLLKTYKQDKQSALSSSGGEGKAAKSQLIDDFARKEYFKYRDSYPRFSNIRFADFLIERHGENKVGAQGPLRRKIASWKKENK